MVNFRSIFRAGEIGGGGVAAPKRSLRRPKWPAGRRGRAKKWAPKWIKIRISEDFLLRKIGISHGRYFFLKKRKKKRRKAWPTRGGRKSSGGRGSRPVWRRDLSAAVKWGQNGVKLGSKNGSFWPRMLNFGPILESKNDPFLDSKIGPKLSMRGQNGSQNWVQILAPFWNWLQFWSPFLEVAAPESSGVWPFSSSSFFFLY